MEIREKLNAGDEIEIEICPSEGEYAANTVDGKPFVEKFSPESMQKVVDNWKSDGSKPILCDIDHSSVDTGNTQAAGWVTNLWLDESAKRLKGTLQVSESGANLLNGLEYRYVSPVLFFTDDNYPYFLDSISLTNTPRLEELRPVYNSKIVNISEEKPVMEEQEKEIITTEDRLKEELKAILGLPTDATFDDVIKAVTEISDKLKAIADADMAKEAEEAVNECGQAIEEDKKEEILNCYKQNPTLVKSVLNCVRKQPANLVCNAQEAIKPELTDEKLKREYAALKGGKDKVDFLKAHPSMKL